MLRALALSVCLSLSLFVSASSVQPAQLTHIFLQAAAYSPFPSLHALSALLSYAHTRLALNQSSRICN